MSASQFDDLLGEFGDSGPTVTKMGAVGASDDGFDPFGPSPGADQTSHLLDFSSDNEIRGTNGIESDFGATTSPYSAAVMSSDAPSSGLLFDLDSETDANQSSGHLYQYSEEATSSSKAGTHLYDFDNDGTTAETAEDVDFIPGTNEGQTGGVDFLQDEPQEGYEDQGYDTVVTNGHGQVAPEPEDFIQEEERSQDVENLEYAEQVHEEQEADIIADDPPHEAPAEFDAPTEPELLYEAEPAAETQEPTELPYEAESLENPAELPYESETAAETEDPVELPSEAESPAVPHQLIPDVEITETEQSYSPQDEREEPSRIRDESDKGEAAGGFDDAESIDPQSSQPADAHHEQLVADHFGHDRREKDLEHYCMDREESDLMDEQDSTSDTHTDTLKPREERSRSPSRSIGPDVPEERNRHEPSATPDTDTTDELDTLRPREDRSHAPSRSLEPEERPKEEVPQDASDVSSHPAAAAAGDKYPDHGHEKVQAVEQSELPATRTSAPQKQVDSHSFQQEDEEDDDEEEGIYENQPSRHRDDVARETDTDRSVDLPASGTAQSMREKFLAAQQNTKVTKREITPPAHGAGGEYVSEPRGFVEKYEGRAESGVFESQPVVNTDIITSSTAQEEAKYEAGHAKSTAAKFVEMQSKSYSPSGKRELTPDRSGRVEYVSEPRGQFEKYEGKSESGVFESEPVVNPDVIRAGEDQKEELPERGTAKNLAEKYRQITSESASPSAGSRGQRTEDYETERGHARNVAAKFKELETNVKSPPLSPRRRKEFTPPRDDERYHQSGVIENNPDFKSDIIHSGDQQEEALPERGTAKNIAQRFKQLESESKVPVTSRPKREITPPPGDAGVYENQPKQFQADYNRPAESGIIENQPLKRDDVIRGDEPPKYEEELPERGAAKNLVNKWKQLESESSKVKSPVSGRPKEFTPPREEPRIAEQRKSPRTPLSPSGNDQLDNGSVHPSDLPGQYQPQNEPTVFESTPQPQRPDVLRSGESDWTEGMPKKNQAKKMLAKFQNIQAEANKQSPGPVSNKAKDVRNK